MMEKSKLSSLGERLKNQGAQMGRMMSTKVKDLLQTPTPESKMVDEATLDSLTGPNWGLNLRICAMINSGEFNGSDVVRSIKKKLSGRSVVSQTLCLDLLEACAMNCEKVFSEVASEKVLDEMMRVIDSLQTDQKNRRRVMELIRAWGESEDLAYLPVFRQTYLSLKNRATSLEDGNSQTVGFSSEPYEHEDQLSFHENYHIPDSILNGSGSLSFPYNYGSLSVEGKKEFLVITRNSLNLLLSMLNSGTEQQAIKDDLTLSMVQKCKQSLPLLQSIIESTSHDESMLFEVLNLHDELQQVISRCEVSEVDTQSEQKQLENPNSLSTDSSVLPESRNLTPESEFHKENSIDCGRNEVRFGSETIIDNLPK